MRKKGQRVEAVMRRVQKRITWVSHLDSMPGGAGGGVGDLFHIFMHSLVDALPGIATHNSGTLG